jgi:dolichol-phosphate mannosyltransferase
MPRQPNAGGVYEMGSRFPTGRCGDSGILVPLSALVTIIVPVFNEAKTVAAVIARLLDVPLPADREILVVNDGSTDGTRSVLDALPADPRVRIIHAERNGGKGRAIRTGLADARGVVVAIQDADLELDPAQLADLVSPILDGHARVVYGSRFLSPLSSAPWLTVAANRALTGVTNLLYGSRITDMETCYKIMATDVARALDLESNRFDIEPEITAKLLRAGHTIHERPVRFEPRSRAQGKKIGWRDGVRALQVLVKYRWS